MLEAIIAAAPRMGTPVTAAAAGLAAGVVAGWAAAARRRLGRRLRCRLWGGGGDRLVVGEDSRQASATDAGSSRNCSYISSTNQELVPNPGPAVAVTRPQYRSGLVRPGGGNVLTDGLVADDTGDVGEFEDLAARWRSERAERQLRRHLDPADFEALGDLGLWRSAAPHDRGGSWRGAAESIRPLCDSVRTVAAGDPSPALVAAMHPAVLAFWLTHDADHRCYHAQNYPVLRPADDPRNRPANWRARTTRLPRWCWAW